MFRSTTPTAERYVLNDRGFGTHQAIVSLVSVGSRVLDVGCADGSLGAVMRAERDATVVGMEPDPVAAAVAETCLNAVVIGRADDATALDEARALGPFDHVVLGDVLEHMTEPDVVLRALADMLRPGGSLVISLPNVLTLRARARLVAGVWRYEDQGIFDRTHLRFFSVRSAREMVTVSGLRIMAELPVGPLSHRLGRRGVRLTALRPGLLATQVVMRAEPASQSPR